MRERKEKKNDNGMDFAHYFDGALNNIDIIYLFIYQRRFKDFFFLKKRFKDKYKVLVKEWKEPGGILW